VYKGNMTGKLPLYMAKATYLSCVQVHGLDGQHQDADRTLRGRVNQNDRGQRQMEKVRPWCGQPSDRGRLKNNRTEQSSRRGRPRTAWMDNIKTWTGLSVKESIRMTEDRDKWRKYISCSFLQLMFYNISCRKIQLVL